MKTELSTSTPTVNGEFRGIARTGLLGLASTSAGSAISLATTLEAWLRVASLLIGIAVGILTLINLVRTLRK